DSITAISARSMSARCWRPAASYWLMESRRCLTIFSSTASTWASSSSMRSSTSRCLIAALTRRITPRRALSPAFMAVFMSSVSCCLRVMLGLRKQRRPATRCVPAFGNAWRWPGRAARSVHPLALGDVARGAAGLALHRGGGLALALLGRLLVELALAGLGEHAGLLAGALEATEGKLERLVFADFDAGHLVVSGGWAALWKGRAAYDNGCPMEHASA